MKCKPALYTACALLAALSDVSSAQMIVCRDGQVRTPDMVGYDRYCTFPPVRIIHGPPTHRPGGPVAPSPPAVVANPMDRDGDGRLDCWKDAVGPATPGERGRGSKTRISSAYGPSKWRTGDWHYGVDLVSDTGNFGLNQPVRAISDGVVAAKGKDIFNGNSVTLHHPDGRASKYLHLKDISVSVTRQIRAGDVIGTMNCTGACGRGLRKNNVRSTHAHIEVLTSQQADRNREGRIDPIPLMGDCK